MPIGAEWQGGEEARNGLSGPLAGAVVTKNLLQVVLENHGTRV